MLASVVRPNSKSSATSTIELSERRSSKAIRRKRPPISCDTLTDNFTDVPEAGVGAFAVPGGLPLTRTLERFRPQARRPASRALGFAAKRGSGAAQPVAETRVVGASEKFAQGELDNGALADALAKGEMPQPLGDGRVERVGDGRNFERFARDAERAVDTLRSPIGGPVGSRDDAAFGRAGISIFTHLLQPHAA